MFKITWKNLTVTFRINLISGQHWVEWCVFQDAFLKNQNWSISAQVPSFYWNTFVLVFCFVCLLFCFIVVCLGGGGGGGAFEDFEPVTATLKETNQCLELHWFDWSPTLSNNEVESLVSHFRLKVLRENACNPSIFSRKYVIEWGGGGGGGNTNCKWYLPQHLWTKNKYS